RRLCPYRHREDRRGQGLLEGNPGGGADGLPVLLLQRDGLLRRGGDAGGGRGPQAGAVPARHPPRAESHRIASDLARYERARSRRDLDLPVLPARARADPRPVRDVPRRAHAHPLLPGGRRDRGHPRRLRAKAARVLEDHAQTSRRVRRDPQLERDRPAEAARRLPARRGDAAGTGCDRTPAARRGQPLGPAQGGPLQLLWGLPVQDPGRHGRRQLRPLRRAPGRDIRVGEDHRAGAGRTARGTAHHRGPQDRAASPPWAGDLHGGTDPPFQARHRGLPRGPRGGLLPDRVPARGARLLRARRRLLKARPRTHARPLLRQSPGPATHGRGQLHRRHDRHPGDARPDPRWDRQMSPAHRDQTVAHGLRWDRAADLEKDPAEVPDPERVEVPQALREEIEAHMANYPDRRSAALPALEAAQRLHGWCSPEAIEQVACAMRVTPAYLESVASFYDMLETAPVGRHSVYVCTNISCSLRGADELYETVRDAATDGIDGEPINVRSFECLGACDIAPMASVDGVYVGPLTPEDVP